uniref:Uncharacterized protein n=1 Tax=Nothoprocta perdicaria TaxID=30464 RepID=A0A8C6ZQH4_NOTPE
LPYSTGNQLQGSPHPLRLLGDSWSQQNQLLRFLQEFSQQTLSRTHEIKRQLDGLVSETKATDCRLHNVFNDFLMLSNTQFIENVSRGARGAQLGCVSPFRALSLGQICPLEMKCFHAVSC